MVEFTRIISRSEANTTYLNLRDENGRKHADEFPAEHLTPLVIVDGKGRVFCAKKHWHTQIWSLKSWFSTNGVSEGTRVLVKHDPAERSEGLPVVYLIPESMTVRAPRWSRGNSFSRKESIDAGQYHDELVGGGVVEPPWSEWVMVADWLDRGAAAGLKPPEAYGVYRFQVGPAHPTYAGRLLYIGSTQKKTPGKVGRGVDNFTGLRPRIWQFISSALGFGMKTNPGCRIGKYGVSARDLEASWAVVDCPSASTGLS